MILNSNVFCDYDFSSRLVKVEALEKLLDNNDYPSSEDVEDIILNSLNVYDDVSIIDAHEYVNKKKKRQAEREELEKLQDIESEMYGLDDK